MDHIIRRQLLELTLDGSHPPFNLQNRLREEYYHTLLPILEEWFDRLAGEEEVLHIDTLTLDLGHFSIKDLNDEELRQRLTQKLHSPETTIALHTTNGHSPSTQRSTTRHNACQQWLSYMEKGYLPWNLLHPDKEWEKKVLETLATDYAAISRLRTMLTSQPATLARIARQQDEIFLTKLAEILTTVAQTTLPQTLQELRQLLTYSSHLETSKIDHVPSSEKIWQDTLSLAATLTKEGTTPELGRRILNTYWADHKSFVPVLQDYLAAHSIAKELMSDDPPQSTSLPADDSDFAPNVTTALHRETGAPLHNQLISPEESTKKPNPDGSPSSSTVTPANKPISPGNKSIPEPPPAPPKSDAATPTSEPVHKSDAPASAAKEKAKTQTNTEAQSDTKAQADKNTQSDTTKTPPEHFSIDQLPEEGIFLLNAGVILTHPFLNHLFKITGLVANGKFIAGEARQKAIHLLHYLATGRTVAEEYELATAKIICGCPLEEPMEKTVVYTEEELKEADSLLEGLISHWGVKGVTIEGLRGNFLTRSGKLSTKTDKIQLVMEKHAVDILIRTYPFPWNMSIVKLPWQRQPIHLDW